MSLFQRRPHSVPCLVAALMLLLALAPWPYGYYQLMRWAVCGAAVFVAFMAYTWKRIWATWVFGVVAVLFNPLVPIHLTREIWQPVDLTVAALFVVAVFVVRKT